MLFGDAAPSFAAQATLQPFDTGLNPSQQEAVRCALAARDVALVHGPPGTGKTRTLVEVVRQSVALGERVLVAAASNTAVDNVAERLAELEPEVVRLGHPARVAPAMEARTLDALVQSTEQCAWRVRGSPKATSSVDGWTGVARAGGWTVASEDSSWRNPGG